jgi:DNA-binding NarL/FixJ family response regulator
MTKPVKVLIVDDHLVLREGLVSLINPQPDFEVVGEAGSVSEAVAKATELQPDLILMDISLPDGTGVEATRAILSQRPSTKIVMLTIHETDELLFDAIRSGAKGYMLKNTPVSKLITSLRALERGEPAMPRKLTARILEEFARLGKLPGPGEAELQSLTPREVEVLDFLAANASNRQIADQLVISENTVKNHVQSILKKLNFHSRREASKFARRLKFPDDPENRF